MSDAACPFCHLKERVLKENHSAQAFLSNPRKMPGHFLVSPKRHVEKPWELTTGELGDIFELINFIEQRLIEKFGNGCDIRQNYRPFMKQSQLKVDHIHFHIMPRSLFDELYGKVEQYETAVFTKLEPDENKTYRELLN